MFLRERDKIVWKRTSGGFGQSIIEDLHPMEPNKIRVRHIQTTSSLSMYIWRDQVMFVICPLCGTGRMSLEGGRLQDARGVRFCNNNNCSFREVIPG